MKFNFGYLILSVIGASLLSCANPAGTGGDSAVSHDVSITGVSYSIDSVPPDWWASNVTTKPGLIYNFTVYFGGSATASDFSSARVYLPGTTSTYWTLGLPGSLDFSKKTISGTGFWLSDNRYELPIGDLKVEIVLANGKSATYVFTMGRPGSTTAGGIQYVYSADDETTPTYPSVTLPALRRPSVSSLTNNGTTVQTIFTIAGQNSANGRVWFYDDGGNYVGRSMLFRDAISGAATSRLTGGIFSNGDGQTNTLALGASDITSSAGNAITSSTLATISHCRVYVIDGSQYAALSPPSYGNYDYRAISSYY